LEAYSDDSQFSRMVVLVVEVIRMDLLSEDDVRL